MSKRERDGRRLNSRLRSRGTEDGIRYLAKERAERIRRSRPRGAEQACTCFGYLSRGGEDRVNPICDRNAREEKDAGDGYEQNESDEADTEVRPSTRSIPGSPREYFITRNQLAWPELHASIIADGLNRPRARLWKGKSRRVGGSDGSSGLLVSGGRPTHCGRHCRAGKEAVWHVAHPHRL